MPFIIDESMLDLDGLTLSELYQRPYPGGFRNSIEGYTPLTAPILNAIDEGILRASNQYQIVASAASMPSSPVAGQVVYRQDLQELLLYRGSAWGPLARTGSILQTVVTRSDSRVAYSSAASGNGTTVGELGLTITPRYASSHIWCRWMITGEFHQDNVFVLHKDGALVTSGPVGYNSQVGNVRYSGIMPAFYDQNEDSTPSTWRMHYLDDTASSAATRTYAPAVRGSGASAYTFYLNRTVNAATQDNYEQSISYGIAMEIQR